MKQAVAAAGSWRQLLLIVVASIFLIYRVEGSLLSDALSAAFVEVVADGTTYGDSYKSFSIDTPNPDVTSCPLYPTLPTSGPLADIIGRKTIRFGVSPFEPAAFSAPNSTIFDGAEVRIGRLIAAKLGRHYGVGPLTAEWVLVLEDADFFGKLKGGLDAGRYDAVFSSVTITTQRSTLVDFTCSYFTSYQGLLRGPKEPNRNFTAIPQSLNAASVSIGVLGGTTGRAWVDQTMPLAVKVAYNNEWLLVNGVKNSDVHFAVSDRYILAYGLLVQHPPCPNCTLLPGSYGAGDHYGIFTKKDTSPTPTPTPTPKPTPTPRPRPDPHDLRRGTVFSLVVIAIFSAFIVLGVVVGLYFHMKGN